MTWAVIGASLIATMGSIGGAAASSSLSKPGTQPPQATPIPEKSPAPYQPTAPKAQVQLPQPMTQTTMMPQPMGEQLPPPMSPEDMKKLYGMY